MSRCSYCERTNERTQHTNVPTNERSAAQRSATCLLAYLFACLLAEQFVRFVFVRCSFYVRVCVCTS